MHTTTLHTTTLHTTTLHTSTLLRQQALFEKDVCAAVSRGSLLASMTQLMRQVRKMVERRRRSGLLP